MIRTTPAEIWTEQPRPAKIYDTFIILILHAKRLHSTAQNQHYRIKL